MTYKYLRACLLKRRFAPNRVKGLDRGLVYLAAKKFTYHPALDWFPWNNKGPIDGIGFCSKFVDDKDEAGLKTYRDYLHAKRKEFVPVGNTRSQRIVSAALGFEGDVKFYHNQEGESK